MLASAGQPSLHGYDACMVYWTKGALFFSFVGFLFIRNSMERFWGLILWHFLGWEGKTSWATLPAPSCWS